MRCMQIFILLFVVSVSWGAPHFPFPQELNYGQGNVPTLAKSWKIQEKYESWLSNIYAESGSLARLRFDQLTETVSEGIGYGMLIFVFMDNANNKTQSKFDKLYNYYKKYPDAKGLMHWKIQHPSENDVDNGWVSGQNSATDADLDVAMALYMAHYQWGSGGAVNYLQEAKNVTSKILAAEVNGDNTLRPGSAFDDQRNPSYCSPAHFSVFAEHNSGDATRWNDVKSKCYTFVTNNQNNYGLWSDWAQYNGDASNYKTTCTSGDICYGFDAARVPLRTAWDYAWSANSTAKSLINNFASFVISKSENPKFVGGPIVYSTGQMGNWINGTFHGSFVSGMLAHSNATAFNAYYDKLILIQPAGYFNESLILLNLLLTSGNMPDMAHVTADPNWQEKLVVVSSSSAPSSSSSLSSSSDGISSSAVMLDNVSGLRLWTSFVDNAGSVANPAPGENVLEFQYPNTVATATINKVADNGTNELRNGLRVHFNSAPSVSNLSSLEYIQLSYYTQGNFRMSLIQEGVAIESEWGFDLSDTQGANRLSNLYPEDLLQRPGAPYVALDLSKILGIRWSFLDSDGGEGIVGIRSITFFGAEYVGVKTLYPKAEIRIQNQKFTLRGEDVKSPVLKIYDLRGVLISTSSFERDGDRFEVKPTDKISNGIYLFRVEDGNRQLVTDKVRF